MLEYYYFQIDVELYEYCLAISLHSQSANADDEYGRPPIQKAPGSGPPNAFEIQLVNWMRRAEYVEETDLHFHVAISSDEDPFLVSKLGRKGDLLIDIFSCGNINIHSFSVHFGEQIEVKATGFEISSLPSVRQLAIEDRGCRFRDEVQGMDFLRVYTQAGCEFECMVRRAREKCKCTPWSYPIVPGRIP